MIVVAAVIVVTVSAFVVADARKVAGIGMVGKMRDVVVVAVVVVVVAV